jgi:hypothetical protein
LSTKFLTRLSTGVQAQIANVARHGCSWMLATVVNDDVLNVGNGNEHGHAVSVGAGLCELDSQSSNNQHRFCNAAHRHGVNSGVHVRVRAVFATLKNRRRLSTIPLTTTARTHTAMQAVTSHAHASPHHTEPCGARACTCANKQPIEYNQIQATQSTRTTRQHQQQKHRHRGSWVMLAVWAQESA